MKNAGFRSEQLGFLFPRRSNAFTGALLGGICGALVARSVAQGTAPVLLGGLFGGVVGSLAADSSKGLVRAFLNLGLSKEQAHGYERIFRQGRGLVLVQAGDRSAEARSILK